MLKGYIFKDSSTAGIFNLYTMLGTWKQL